MTAPSSEYGARPVPLTTAASTFAAVERGNGHAPLQPVELRTPIARLPDDHAAVLEIARGPLREAAIVPVVGCEGGAGRTTVTRLIAGAFRDARGDVPVIVDAVPMWGGMTACADRPGDYCPADVASMPWPIPAPDLPRMLTAVGGIPTLPGPSPIRGIVCDPATILTAVDRIAMVATLTLVDTVADVSGSPARDLIWSRASALVWVASATRPGIWGIAEVLTYFRTLGADQIARRSVVAVIGPHRRWPADAAAAEAQLAGLGVETVRLPRSPKPLSDGGCRKGAMRLLAAVVARSG